MPVSCCFPKNLRNQKEDVLQKTMQRSSRSAMGYAPASTGKRFHGVGKHLPRCTLEFNNAPMLGDSPGCARGRWGKIMSIQGSRGSGKGWMVR